MSNPYFGTNVAVASSSSISKSNYKSSANAYGALVSASSTATCYAGAYTPITVPSDCPLKSITIKKTSLKLYNTTGSEVTYTANCLYRSSSYTQGVGSQLCVSLTTSTTSPVTSALKTNYASVTGSEVVTPDEFTYEFSSPFTGTLYLWYTVPNTRVKTGYSYAGYSFDIVRPEFSYVKATTAVNTTFEIDGETELSDGTYVIDCDSGSVDISYSGTSDYPFKSASVVKDMITTIATPTAWGDGSIEGYSLAKASWAYTSSFKAFYKNTSNVSGYTEKEYHKYGSPTSYGNTLSSTVKINTQASLSSVYGFLAYCEDDTTLTISSDKGTVSIDDFLVAGQIKINATYTPTTIGLNTVTFTLKDTYLSSTGKTGTNTWSVTAYNPPTVNFTASTDEPSLGETVTFTNTSDESKSGTCKYSWYIDGEIQTIGSETTYPKSTALSFTFTTRDQHVIKLVGWDTAYDSDTDSKEKTYSVPSYIPDIEFEPLGDIYATVPFTAELVIDPTKTGITYKWYHGETYLSTGESYTYTPTSLGADTLKVVASTDDETKSGTLSFTVLNPAPSISLIYTPTTPSKGDSVLCTATVTSQSGAPYTINWKLDGVEQLSHTNTFSFTNSSTLPTTYTVYVEAVVSSWSSSVTQYINTAESYDSMTRYTVVITDNNKYMICTRNNLSSNRFNNLQFEKRLNETGSGSLDLLIKSDTDTDVLVSGSDIIIYDNANPIYYGVLTDVDSNEINPFNMTLTKKYYTLGFSEGCRKLSYAQCANNEIVTESTISTITSKILDSKYIGSVDTYTGTYTFSVSNQDELSQIDSFSEQCGARYRTNINEYCNFYSAEYYNDENLKRSGGFISNIPVGSLVFCKNESYIMVSTVRTEYEQYSTAMLEITKKASCGTVSVGDQLLMSATMPNPIIDFKRTYYQENSIIKSDSGHNALIVNKRAYNIDDIDNLNKHYGSVCVTSPQSGAPNVSCIINLNNNVNPDNTMKDGLANAYISESKDTFVIDAYSTGGSYADEATIVVKGNITTLPYMYIKDGTHYYLDRCSSIKSHTLYRYNGNDIEATIIDTGFTYTELDITEDTWSALIGSVVRAGSYKYVGTIRTDLNVNDINIGGEYIQDATITSDTITLDPTNTYSYNNISHCSGALILTEDLRAISTSPHKIYPDRTLSIVASSNLNYQEVELLASNIARYGSNFTSNVSGTSSIKDFVTTGNRLPMVGDHVALYYNGTQYDYELQSFTVNTQTMTVDFNMGMKPLNIGDVIYRISQNMTTNITTN